MTKVNTHWTKESRVKTFAVSAQEFANCMAFPQRSLDKTYISVHYLEIQMKNVHLVHVLDPLTDVLHEQDRVHLCQIVVFINNSVK